MRALRLWRFISASVEVLDVTRWIEQQIQARLERKKPKTGLWLIKSVMN